MEKKVRLREEPAFAMAHAVLWALSDPDGLVHNGMSRCFLDSALYELNGLYEMVSQEPAEPVEIVLDDLEAGRRQLDDAFAQLLVRSTDLEDALRVVRAQEWAAAAWDELQTVGERV